MHGETGSPDMGHQNVRGRKDPVLLLIIASTVVAGFWSALVLRNVFGLVWGPWYFLAVLWFFKKTNRRWKWETTSFVVIGLVCYYELFWSRVTPEDMRDAQSGLIIIFGPVFSGIAAFLGDAVAALLSFLVRSSCGKDEKEK